MRNYNPKVSIIIPAYNASNYLAEAIDSALAQTYEFIEIIVVNDGSKDNGATAAVAKQYEGKIRYFEKENGGSSSAINVGIQNMTGEWFSWLSHDDLYKPQKVERQIEFLNSMQIEPDKRAEYVLFSASERIDADGRVIKQANLDNCEILAKHLAEIKDNAHLIAEPTKYLFHGCSCLVHRDVFNKIGVFDEKLRLLNDVDMWYRIYSNGYRICYIPEVLVQGRMHAKQVSRSIGFSYHNCEQDMFWQRSLDWLIQNRPDYYALFYLFGRNAFLKTRYDEGKKAFDRAKKLQPQTKLKLELSKDAFVLYAFMRDLAKKVYLKMKLSE